MQELKKALRRSLLERRRIMDENVRKNADKKIYTILAELPEIADAEVILTYISSPIEVDTRMIAEHLLKSGKTVAAPLCVGKEMKFMTIKSLSDLIKSSFGVDEPVGGEEITDMTGTVCITPALAFDRNGFRLGYGGGFYDRFFASHSCLSVGICYHDFIEEIPVGEFDRQVDILVTENETFTFKGNKVIK